MHKQFGLPGMGAILARINYIILYCCLLVDCTLLDTALMAAFGSTIGNSRYLYIMFSQAGVTVDESSFYPFGAPVSNH